MKKTCATVLSLLLALALLLPMAPAAHAATVYATGVDLTASPDSKTYLRSDRKGVITVTASAAPSNYSGTIIWELSDVGAFTADRTIGKEIDYKGNNVIKLTANKVTARPVQISATLMTDANGNTTKSQLNIEVIADEVAACELKPSSLEVEAGKTAKLTVTTTYLSGNGAPPVTLESSNTKVATVSANGTVTGVSVGNAYITATAGGKRATTYVTVTNPTSNLTGTTSIGEKYSLQDMYESMLVQFNNSFGYVTADRMKLTFTNITRNYGTLRTARNTEVTESYAVDFRDLRSMYLESTSAGTFKFDYYLTDGTNTLTGTAIINITTPVKHIRIPVNGSANYSFGEASADGSGKSGAVIIREALGTFGSIRFGSILSGERVGTLYVSPNAKYNDLVGNGTIVASNAVDALYFTPAAPGAYSIAYEAWSGANATGTLLCSGNLIIPVDSASLDLTINLDVVAPYYFSTALSTTTSSGATSTASAAAQLINVINGAVGTFEWNGIRFTAASAAATQVGALYPSGLNATAVNADTYIDYTEISGLYFVPARAGTYEIVYNVYSDRTSNASLASGVLTINVSSVPTGSADVLYTVQAGGTLALKESDFLNFFQNKYNGRYFLSAVTFDEYNGDGTFYYDGQRFIPRNSAQCYSSTFTGTLPASPHYLDRLSFTAPSASGVTAVKFTCYGGTSANSTGITTSGVLHIYYTSSEVAAVSYNAYNVSSVRFTEADFIPAYKSATNSSAANPAFEIKLLNVPEYGTLYRYYSRTGRTALNSANITGYTFAVNGTEADSVSRLEYVPVNWQAGGSETISYLAFAPNGSLLYSGTISFKLAADRTANVYSDGLSFQINDYYQSRDTDPVVYVTFPQPEYGRVYAYNDTAKRYESTTSDTKFYTVSASDGNYAITSALYVPKAGFTGTAQLTCVAHRRSGATYNDNIVVTAMSKNASSVFADVGTDLSWAANAVDFSRRLGLVGGTGTDSAGRTIFSPKNTMRRCDLVLILYRLAGSPVSGSTMPYTDVPSPTTSYSTEIYNSARWAYANGIMRNIADSTVYNPNTAITRQDFAQILFNYTKAMGGNVANNGNINGYSDASQVSANTYEGVVWAVANGYITSTSSGLTIEPTRAATRAEIVTLLHRYLTY